MFRQNVRVTVRRRRPFKVLVTFRELVIKTGLILLFVIPSLLKRLMNGRQRRRSGLVFKGKPRCCLFKSKKTVRVKSPRAFTLVGPAFV